jgi:hypothetical protein
MSIKERALQEHDYAVKAAALDKEAQLKRDALNREHECRAWIHEHFGVDPEEVVLIRRFTWEISKTVAVRLEDDIWLYWASEGKHCQSHAGPEPRCWYINLERNVRQAYNTTKKGLGEGGWDKAVVDVGLAPVVSDLASLGAAIAQHERWKETHG